jgi:hypothetical protein
MREAHLKLVLWSSLVWVHLAMLHQFSFGFEFGAASAALVFFPE